MWRWGTSGVVVRNGKPFERRAGVDLNLFHHPPCKRSDVRKLLSILRIHDNPIMTAVVGPQIDLRPGVRPVLQRPEEHGSRPVLARALPSEVPHAGFQRRARVWCPHYDLDPDEDAS